MELTPIEKDDYELIVQARDSKTGLNAMICIHRTISGRSAGGCRMWKFENEAAMLWHAMRLGKTMTYKAVFSDVHLGGAKAVLLGDPLIDKTPDLYRAMGEFIERFHREYYSDRYFYTGKDVGTETEDIEYMKEKTSHVMDQHFISGNSSLFTAYAMYRGLLAALENKKMTLSDCRIAIQGGGAVARYLLAGLPHDSYYGPFRERFPGLIELCKSIVICDVQPEAIARLKVYLESEQEPAEKVEIVDPQSIFEQTADILMPCALGNVLTLENIEKLHKSCVKIVAGSANSQLPAPEVRLDHYAEADRALYDAGILYAPDYALNVGGLATIGYELERHIAGQTFILEEALNMLDKVYDRLLNVFLRSQNEQIPTAMLTDRIAEKKMKVASLT